MSFTVQISCAAALGVAIGVGLALTSPTANSEMDFSSVESMQKSLTTMTDGMPDTEKKDIGEALLRVLLSRHPNTQGLEGLPALAAMGSLGEKFYTGGGPAFDGITLAVLQKEVSENKQKKKRVREQKAAKGVVADSVLACLKSKVTFANPRYESKDGAWFKVDLTNNLSWAIRGYHVSFRILGDQRSVPIKEGKTSMEISGGVEPGETKTVSVWAGANIKPYHSTKIEVSMLNLFDAENRRLVDNGTNYIDRSPELSPKSCN